MHSLFTVACAGFTALLAVQLAVLPRGVAPAVFVVADYPKKVVICTGIHFKMGFLHAGQVKMEQTPAKSPKLSEFDGWTDSPKPPGPSGLLPQFECPGHNQHDYGLLYAQQAVPEIGVFVPAWQDASGLWHPCGSPVM